MFSKLLVRRNRCVAMVAALLCCVLVQAADIEVYLKHSSGLALGKKSDGKACLVAITNAKKLKLRDAGNGYYLVVDTEADGTEKFLALNGGWNTYFESTAETDNSKYLIEGEKDKLFKLRNKSNNRYLGTDANDAGASVFSDKDGQDIKHFWYMTTDKNAPLPKVALSYMVVPTDRRQQNEGWGVSLCWWANMCGKWSDANIDKLVDWLVSPNGLNYNIFRYNITGTCNGLFCVFNAFFRINKACLLIVCGNLHNSL